MLCIGDLVSGQQQHRCLPVFIYYDESLHRKKVNIAAMTISLEKKCCTKMNCNGT